MISLQKIQLLIKDFFCLCNGTHHILRKLCRNINLISAIVLGQNTSKNFFIIFVDICSIKIVYTLSYCLHHLIICLLKIVSNSASLKAHTSKSKERNIITFFIFAILHIFSFLFYKILLHRISDLLTLVSYYSTCTAKPQYPRFSPCRH